MLTKGDLVRIPQNTYATNLGSNTCALRITRKPQYGIVLEVREGKCTVLFDDAQWEIRSKDLQLHGGISVYKAS